MKQAVALIDSEYIFEEFIVCSRSQNNACR